MEISAHEKMRAIIKADAQRHIGVENFGAGKFLRAVCSNDCLFYVVLYRMCQRIVKIKQRDLRFLLKIPTLYTTFGFATLILGIEIDIKAEIGKGFYIGHYGGIHIGPIKMGKYCNISQGVTIGQGLGRVESARHDIPEIGDYVYFGPNAVVFGGIKIGSHVSIGANSVVSKDIPDHSIVVGNPGRIVDQQEVNLNIHNVFEPV
jgi:serine O-acetyltransferase